MLPSILTLFATGLFIAGMRSLALLNRIDEPSNAERSDPFFTLVALLFSNAKRSDKFRKLQRRTIWLFCGSILLLYVARVAFVQSDVF